MLEMSFENDDWKKKTLIYYRNFVVVQNISASMEVGDGYVKNFLYEKKNIANGLESFLSKSRTK